MDKYKVAIYYDDLINKNKIEYVFNFIFNHFCLSELDVELYFNPKDKNYDISIIYSNKNIEGNKNIFYIMPQKLIFSKNRVDNNTLFANRYKYKSLVCYSVENEKREQQDFIKNKDFNFDLIETIFFHISRYEEFYAKEEELDHHARVKSSEQFLVKHSIYKIPVVDYIVYAFLDSLGIKNLNINTQYSITHDIDAVRKFPSFYKFLRALARVTIKEKNLTKIYKLTFQYLNTILTQKDPYDTFDWLFRNNFSKEKVVYFMSGGITKYDNFYSIKDKLLKPIFEIANICNYTFGLHPSYATPFNKEQFNKELLLLEEVLNKKIVNTRQHILHFSFSNTIDILEEIGIKYDSTLGYQDLIGFRCGTGHNYYLYNFNKDKQSKVQEIPLVVMDGPLLMEAGYNVDKAERIIFDFMKQNDKFTKITFNFHNSTFDEVVCDAKKFKNLYFKINEYIKSR